MRTLKISTAEATRKELKIRKQNVESFDIESINKDTTQSKMASHRRFKSEILGNTKYLDKYTKSNLM